MWAKDSRIGKPRYDSARYPPRPRHSKPPPTMTSTDQLKTLGLKVTGPRLKILALFEQTDRRHLTAEDVYRLLLTDSVDVGLATVYRVLTQFEQAGLLARNHFEGGRAMFELKEGPHHDHLVCLDCGRVEEFVDSEIEARQSKVAAERGFALHDHALALYCACVKSECEFRPRK